jgi:hypothetical protein
VPPSVDYDAMPQVWRLVAAFRLVCGIKMLEESGNNGNTSATHEMSGIAI